MEGLRKQFKSQRTSEAKKAQYAYFVGSHKQYEQQRIDEFQAKVKKLKELQAKIEEEEAQEEEGADFDRSFWFIAIAFYVFAILCFVGSALCLYKIRRSPTKFSLYFMLA